MGRWRDLDFEPWRAVPAPEASPEAGVERPAAARRYRALAGMPGARHPAVAAARGLYLLKNWQGAVDALAPATLRQPTAEGGWLVCGLALARLNEDTAARAAFERAVSSSPDDLFTRCAYASFLLRSGRDAEAGGVLGCWGVGVLGDEPPAPSSHSLTKVSTPQHPNTSTPQHPCRPIADQFLGACAWAEGQRRLGAGQAADAAERFAAAGERFVAAGKALAVARRALPERLGAVYVGQAVSLLAAGQIEAALQLYGRLRPAGVTLVPPVDQLAKGLHEIGRLLVAADVAERRAVAEPLIAIVAGARMAVALWDGGQAVTIAWRGGCDS